MTKRRDLIPCGHCNGTGRVDLPFELAETLAFVRTACDGEGVTAPDVHLRLLPPDASPTAANQRLERLLALGLVARRSKRLVEEVRRPHRAATSLLSSRGRERCLMCAGTGSVYSDPDLCDEEWLEDCRACGGEGTVVTR